MSNIYVLRQNQPAGPFSEEDLRAQVARGELAATDLAWREGMPEWRALAEVFTISPARPGLPPPPPPRARAIRAPRKRVPPVHVMTGLTEYLEVFPDRLTITPRGGEGFKTNGSQGIRTIPMQTLTAIAFKLPKFTSGLLQFTLTDPSKGRGARPKPESGGIYENMFRFIRNDENIEAAGRITEYVDERLREGRAAPTAAGPAALSDEIGKLAALRERGVLSEAEFQQAKTRLLA